MSIVSIAVKYNGETALECNPEMLKLIQTAAEYSDKNTGHCGMWHDGRLHGVLDAFLQTSRGALHDELQFLKLFYLMR